MASKNGTQAAVHRERWAAYVVEQLWAGREPGELVRELEERGMDSATAAALVQAVEDELRRGGAL